MKDRKMPWLLAVAFVIAMAASGCGGQQAEEVTDPTDSVAPETETVEHMDLDELYQQAKQLQTDGDYEAAMAAFEQLYELGDVRGAEALASNYERGEGIKQNYQMAMEWYEKAGEMGSGRASTNLGQYYENGAGVEKDYLKALECYEKSMTAATPDFKGPRRAGLIYENGLGVDVDLGKAAEYYTVAAENGDITGATLVGAMYAEGRGVDQSYENAAKYYEVAASQSSNNQSADAAYALGALYRDGLGVAQDTIKAVIYLQQAASFNHADAIAALGEFDEVDIQAAKDSKPAEDGRPAGGGPAGNPGGMIIKGHYTEQAKLFEQLTYTAEETGLTIPYNLFLPEGYEEGREEYPLVIFIADSGVNTDNAADVLTQDGATVWTLPEEQEKHPCIVLAPQYTNELNSEIGALTTDEHIWTDGLTLVKKLMDYVIEEYRVDESRIYGTGQSQGGMSTIAISDKYPDFYAAQLLVACKWDAEEMSAMADDNLWIIVCQGDEKAFPGMNEVTEHWVSMGANVATDDVWYSHSSKEEFANLVAGMLDQDCAINYTVLKDGSHMFTWSVAYTIEGIRDWLFEQTR